MQLYNIKDHSEVVDFAQAVRQGLGRQQGLFFPSEIKEIPDVDSILDLPLRDLKLYCVISSAMNFRISAKFWPVPLLSLPRW